MSTCALVAINILLVLYKQDTHNTAHMVYARLHAFLACTSARLAGMHMLAWESMVLLMSPMHELAKKYASPKRKFAIVEKQHGWFLNAVNYFVHVVFSTVLHAGSAEAASYAPLILVYPEIL